MQSLQVTVPAPFLLHSIPVCSHRGRVTGIAAGIDTFECVVRRPLQATELQAPRTTMIDPLESIARKKTLACDEPTHTVRTSCLSTLATSHCHKESQNFGELM